jgi:hypothetical protein
MTTKKICEFSKNSQEAYHFRLGEYKGHRFVDLRLFVAANGGDPLTTKKGLTVAPHLWPQFRRALARQRRP